MDTFSKFNFPDSLIKEYENWYLLLRFKQPTLGSLILITKHGETQYSEMEEDSFIDFSKIVKEIESVLKSKFKCQKINYLMLMMDDPEVHYHIIPRYSESVLFHNILFEDYGWPAMPALNKTNDIQISIEKKLLEELIYFFKNK